MIAIVCLAHVGACYCSRLDVAYLALQADEVRRITSLLYISEMVRSRVELERLYARSFGDEEEPTPDKLRSLLRSYGGCYSDELSKASAPRCPNHPTWFERTSAR